jgi:hypothetical protein
VIGGADKVSLSSTSGSSVTVSSTGSAFSTARDDIHIVASIVNGGATLGSAPFALTSRRPFRLVRGLSTPTICDEVNGWATLVPYTLKDNVSQTFPSTAVPGSEVWTTGAEPDMDNDWGQPTANVVSITNGVVNDLITGPTLSNPTHHLTPNCSAPTTAVQHWGQKIFVGGPSGAGTPVQTDTLYRYLKKGDHVGATSPVP